MQRADLHKRKKPCEAIAECIDNAFVAVGILKLRAKYKVAIRDQR